MSLIKEEVEVDEPDLVYFQPVPQAPIVPPPTPPALIATPNYALRNPPFRNGYPSPPRFHPFLQPQTLQSFSYPSTSLQSVSYDLSNTSYPYIPGNRGEGDQIQLYSSQIPPDLHQGQMSSDSLIQEEVNRTAKTLFSKRNRTLLRWLNPQASKGQLKIDVDLAWECLPQQEKVFYISQVLGKFAPHTTSLMVNPQLDSSGQNKNGEIVHQNKEGSQLKPTKERRTKGRPVEKRKTTKCNIDDQSYEPVLMISEEEPKTKRKYTKRKSRESANISVSGPESSCDPQHEKGNIETEPTGQYKNTAVETKITNEKKKDKHKTQSSDTDVPRVKRKYIKRKLERKKYTRRIPKDATVDSKPQTVEEHCEKIEVPEQLSDLNDDWINFDRVVDFELTNEEVDSFWESIDDPNSLFMELEIE